LPKANPKPAEDKGSKSRPKTSVEPISAEAKALEAQAKKEKRDTLSNVKF
jgi:hypothetical protein